MSVPRSLPGGPAAFLAAALLVATLHAGAAAATPVMEVRGSGVPVVDGDTTPTTADGTDFGSASVAGGVSTHTFTILNTGTTSLDLFGPHAVQVSGAAAADFTVTAQPAGPVPASGSTTFDVTFAPSALGVRTAQLSIANGDPARNPYDFAIQGTGVPLPEPSAALGLALGAVLFAARGRRSRA